MSVPKVPARPAIITGNRLGDGRVVWLRADNAWSESCGQARIFAPAELAEGLATGAAEERAQHLVGVYAVEVEPGTGWPLRLRERLRAKGPSVDAEPKPALSLAS